MSEEQFETDEMIALKLQTQFDQEADAARDVEENDFVYAKNLAASYHTISDSDDEMPNSSDKEIYNNSAHRPTNDQSENINQDGIEINEISKRSSSKRPLCKYGAECYRKNPMHLSEFYHPSSDQIDDNDDNNEFACSQSKKANINTTLRKYSNTESSKAIKPFQERLRMSAPFYLFLNKNYSCKETEKDWLTLVFPDIISKKMGTLLESTQINFMVDLRFVMEFYKAAGLENRPLLFLYGQLEGNPKEYPNVTCKRVDMPFQYGVHHSKMMLLHYKEGCRIVIHTANLIEDDWMEKTQGYWVSPLFPPLDNGKASLLEGESSTRFKRDLVDYLLSYKIAEITRWTEILKSHDMSECRAFFVGSIPGYHVGETRFKYGHLKCRNIIRKYSAWSVNCTRPVIVQCSSIGSLGKDSKSWLSSELGVSLSGGNDSTTKSSVQVIYPSEDNVKNSSQGYGGGSCLPYNSNTHSKQTWLKDHLHCWKSYSRGRSSAMPHIKTYCRLASDSKSVQYFILTSSNLSKAAWGQLQKQGSQLFIRSYEAGVMLLPKCLTENDSFKIISNSDSSSGFQLPYDLPLVPYRKEDLPWLMDTRKSSPDIFGNTYP